MRRTYTEVSCCTIIKIYFFVVNHVRDYVVFLFAIARQIAIFFSERKFWLISKTDYIEGKCRVLSVEC